MTQSLNIVVLVSGRGTNLQALIDASHQQKIMSKVTCVVSNKADAYALERAKQASILTKTIPSVGLAKEDFQSRLLQTVKSLNPGLIVLAGFMRILNKDFVATFAGKIINIHPSLLPKYPGLNAHQQALDAGEAITGCTVHYVDEGCDTGPIILQKTEAIIPDDTEETLSGRLLLKEHEALIEAIQLIENNSGEL
jgi:phosphoribosylglycinamide formyltransferase 1